MNKNVNNLLKNEIKNSFYLIPSSQIFKKILDLCIENKVADLVIQEGRGISIITPTKETKLLDKINKNISNISDFIMSCLNDIIQNSSKLNDFITNEDISEINVGINYLYNPKINNENNDINSLTQEVYTVENTTNNKGKIIRLRCTCIKELRGYQINIRIGNSNIPDYKSLGIPEEFKNLFNYKDGIILVAGPTGSGKTTTINSLLREVLINNNKHLLTLEDPVEYVYNDDEIKGLVTYRELGTNFKTFAEGIKTSLRLSPNIIMIGEIRDAETANLVLEAVLGGHLIISTLHTSSVIGTIQKFIKWAQMSKNEENISVFGDFLRGIMIQKLIKVNINGEKTIIPVREILYGDKKIADAIKNEQQPQYGYIKNRLNEIGVNSISMNKYLISLYKKGILNSPADIFDNSNDIDGLLSIIDEDKPTFDKLFENKKEEFLTLYKKYKEK